MTPVFSKARRARRASATAGRTPDALDVLQSLWALDHALQVRSRRLADEIGVTGPQRLALRLIAAERCDSPSALAKRLVLHKSTVTGIVSRLEEAGLITCTRDESDGRRTTLSLTEHGHRLTRPHPRSIEASVAAAVDATSPEALRHACRFLTRLTAALLPPGEGTVAAGQPTRKAAARP